MLRYGKSSHDIFKDSTAIRVECTRRLQVIGYEIIQAPRMKTLQLQRQKQQQITTQPMFPLGWPLLRLFPVLIIRQITTTIPETASVYDRSPASYVLS